MSITSPSSSGMISSKNANKSLSSSNFLYSSSLKSSSCFSNFFEMAESNLVNALFEVVSRRGRRFSKVVV